MSLCFAVLIKELYDALPNATERAEYGGALQSLQSPETGLFMDPALNPDDLEPASPGTQYLVHQTTYFALNALDALGFRPLYPLRFAESYLQPMVLEDWLQNLDWANPWRESNRIMFIATALYTMWQWENEASALAVLHRLLDWLDAHQDSETGLWGVAEGASPLYAMAGAYHLLPFYFSLGRPARFCDKMVENVLSLQQSDGLFHPQGGGDSCLDVDAVGVLVWCSLAVPAEADRIRVALERTFEGLLANQSDEGGFCRARLRPHPPKTWKRRVAEFFGLDRLLHQPYRPCPQIMTYEGWKKMPFDIRQPDLWSTWFRSYGLAMISARFPGRFLDAIPWRFRRLPGLGWYDPGAIRRAYEKA